MRIQYTVWDMAIVRAALSIVSFATVCRSSCCPFPLLFFSSRISFVTNCILVGFQLLIIFRPSLHSAYGAGAFITHNNIITTSAVIEYVPAQ